MKQNLLKTMLVSTALVAGTMGVWADNGNGIITSLPVETQTFDDANGVFKGGETGDFGGTVGNVLGICATTATATFDSDADTEGNQAYVLASNEKVTINFTAFQGWINSGISEFKILNSEGNSLVSYKYDHNLYSISEVKIGGVDVAGFEAFACQSGPAASGKNCNGFSHSGKKDQGYINDDTKNPQITITVSGNGFVSIRFVISALGIDKEFSSSVGDLKTDLASISISSGVTTKYKDRAYAIDNFSIGTETTQEATASYIVKKMCGTTELGSETGAGVVGTTPTLAGADMWVDGKKYIYVGNDVEEKGGIAASGSTYTLTYREAETYNYSVIGKVDDVVIKEFAKDKNFEGETVSSPYLRYVEKDGVWYEAVHSTSTPYKTSAVLTADNQDLVVSYKKADINNVAFFAEAEDISSLTSVESGYVPDRCSGAKAAFAASDAVIAHLSAGSYKIKASVFGNPGLTFNFKVGDKTVYSPATTGSYADSESEVFTLDADAEVVLAAGGNGGRSPKVVDYIAIMKTAEPVAVSAIKFATYVPTCNVVAPANVKVYTAKVNEAKSAVVLAEVPESSVIAKGTPVLVGAEAGSYTFTASAGEAATVADNDLKAATADTKGDGSTIYALVEQDGKAVFAPLKEGVAVSVGHAYLVLPAASAARFYSIQFGGETTGINEVNAAAKADGAYYTLQGVKTSKAAKGIYIHNGKKVVIK